MSVAETEKAAVVIELPDSDDSQDKTAEVAGSSLEKLQFLAEDSLEYFQEQKASYDTAVSEGKKKYESGPLPKVQTSLDDIKQRLLCLIAQGEQEEEEEMGIIYSRPEGLYLDETQKISLVSHTMAAFISILDEHLLRRIARHIFSETTLWISRMFRFFNSSAYFHRDHKEGMVKIIRLLLHSHYVKYATHGYEALYTRPPVIYCHYKSHPVLEQYLCSELGLPVSCVVSIPGMVDSPYKIDVALLEKRVLEDVAAAKIPLLVIASVGMPIFGFVDDLPRLQEICRSHNIWLHLDGHALAAVGLTSSPNLPVNIADSMTFSLGKWIGMSALPFITLYKSQEAAIVHACGLGPSASAQLDCLPFWVTVQAMGYESISRKIQHCFELTDYLLSKIQAHKEFRVLSKVPVKMQNDIENSDVNKTNITMALLEAVSSSIVFQYFLPSSEIEKDPNVVKGKNPPYFDNLNSWLIQLLTRNVPSVRTDILDLDDHGICLRVCFFETAHAVNTEKKDIDYYYICLQHQLSILNATAKQREVLQKNHANHHKLKLVEIREWAGMGGARYIPDMWADRLNELPDSGKEDINNLNDELVAKLKTTDSAFSVGEADDGMLCVRFGMVDEDLNMDELINLVISTGQEIEDSSRFLETMTEMVKHGIEAANKELVHENEEKLLQEGILKQVPVLGSFVNWWFPPQHETGIKGRSFNLSSGTIESTENIYKYHMQIKEGGPHTPSPATKILVSVNTPSNQVTSPSQQKDQSPQAKQ